MSAFFNIGLEKIADGTIAFGSDVFKARISRTADYTYSATDASMTPCVAYSGTTDPTLGSVSIKTGTDGGCIDWADAVWTAVTSGTAITQVVIYKYVTSDALSFPIAFINGFTVTPNGGDITLQWAAANPFVFKI